MSHFRTALCALVAAGAAVTLATGPAHAGTNISVHTSDPWQSGTAGFQADGEKVTVCDNRGDGMRATAIFTYTASTGSKQVRVSDTNGSGNGCATKDFAIPEGNRVLLQVCVQDGAQGALRHCSTTKEGKA
ncbi:hypothetical protein ACIF9R_04490 [Streptomyces sp. NPDC086080]|uniref:hypothetical protein n=1 Tax=Streptomyces sp. NPDC086080 TaxID=3365748 RepID=UPI0037D0E575